MASRRRTVLQTSLLRSIYLPIGFRSFLRIAPRILLGTLLRTVPPTGLRILRAILRIFLGTVLRTLLRIAPHTLETVRFLKGQWKDILRKFPWSVPLSRTGRRVRW